MLILRWNLFNGGQDKEMKNAALSREKESLSNRSDKLIKLQKRISVDWITYRSLQRQEHVLIEAKKYSQKTFDIY
jgi:outer membrane protein TolC